MNERRYFLFISRCVNIVERLKLKKIPVITFHIVLTRVEICALQWTPSFSSTTLSHTHVKHLKIFFPPRITRFISITSETHRTVNDGETMGILSRVCCLNTLATLKHATKKHASQCFSLSLQDHLQVR